MYNLNIIYLYRLITAECDKTIKIWKEDENATPETHPIEDIKMEFHHNY
jgi:pleiotropic regulator 1